MMWLTKHGHARLNRREETFPCRTKTKELNLMLHPHHTAIFLLFLLQTPAELGERGAGVLEWCVLGVCRLTRAQAAICHPTLASLILYPEPSLAQQARCLIPTKRLPAGGGGEVGGDKGGEEQWEPHSEAL